MAERETLEVDVLIVGGGAAGLACAIRLLDAATRQNPDASPPSVLVLEKGVEVGAHSLSGAVLDPRALDELLPDWRTTSEFHSQPVSGDEIWLLSETHHYKLPHLLVPPALHNAGNVVIALGELTAFLAAQARSRGVEILEGVAGASVLLEDNVVCGVRCGDTGVGRDGEPLAHFQPGADIRARVTVFAEGVRGSLTKTLVRDLDLAADRNPQSYALGVKELWELPAGTFPAGRVIHTLGYPLQHTFLGGEDAFGGGFIYGLDETHLVIGLVTGLDYSDPALDPHERFNRLKTHTSIRSILEKGKLVRYGAKAIPEGGYYAMPRLSGAGFALVGDSAGFLNAARLKGVHLAMKSGMLAAEAIVTALAAGTPGPVTPSRYDELFKASWAHDELYAVRNWRAAYSEGILPGAVLEMTQRLSGGRGVRDPLRTHADSETYVPLARLHPDGPPARLTPDGIITFDKVSDVYHSGTQHEEAQPCHLKVPDLELCATRCHREYGHPCQHFCPAAVYEWLGSGNGAPGRLQINAGNCVHCKTCDIKDPYGNIIWTVPEGGGGPRYHRM